MVGMATTNNICSGFSGSHKISPTGDCIKYSHIYVSTKIGRSCCHSNVCYKRYLTNLCWKHIELVICSHVKYMYYSGPQNIKTILCFLWVSKKCELCKIFVEISMLYFILHWYHIGIFGWKLYWKMGHV